MGQRPLPSRSCHQRQRRTRKEQEGMFACPGTQHGGSWEKRGEEFLVDPKRWSLRQTGTFARWYLFFTDAKSDSLGICPRTQLMGAFLRDAINPCVSFHICIYAFHICIYGHMCDARRRKFTLTNTRVPIQDMHTEVSRTPSLPSGLPHTPGYVLCVLPTTTPSQNIQP